MPYNKPFLEHVIRNKIINASPKFKLYRYNTELKTYSLIKELPASCEYIETTTEIGAKCTATDNSSDSYTVDKIELHVNTYSYDYGGETHSDTKIDTVYVTANKTGTQQLKIEDKVVFTATLFARR